ncbi:MAG: phosphotransferase [Sulfurovaceae bacterium]|nr:phosphotransferase [Sulfurovaceae bacterium]
MGIKTTITSSQLPVKYQKYKLIPTTHGFMATVYLLDDKYVLKLFELDTPLITIESEIKLLSSLINLPIPKVVDRFQIDNHEIVIYTQIQGESISSPIDTDIEQIGKFLKKFHNQSKNIKLNNEKLFERDRLKTLIDLTKNRTLVKYFENISLELNNNGVIHGDLFIDNCKFQNHKLSGVFDFSDACCGDFYFDLAVVAIDWCFEKNILNKPKVDILLQSYQSDIDYKLFKKYIKYALLYYTTTRFISNRNGDELLGRLEYL